MDEREWQKTLREIAEEEASGDVDLWPAIESQVRRRRRPLKRLLTLAPRLASATVLLAIIGLFAGWLASVGTRPGVAPMETTTPAAGASPTFQATQPLLAEGVLPEESGRETDDVVMETDAEVILNQIEMLVERHEAHVLAGGGWLDIETRHLMPGSTGVSWRDIATGESGIYPSEEFARHRWYRLEPNRRFSAGLSLTYDAEGKLWERSVFTDGAWTNLTPRETGDSLGEPRAPLEDRVLLPGARALRELAFILSSNDGSTVTLEAEEENGLYRVTAISTPPEPVTEPRPDFTESVDASRTTLTFALPDGQLLGHHVHYRTTDGRWLLSSGLDVVAIGYVEELHPSVAQLYQEMLEELATTDRAAESGLELAAINSGVQGITVTVQNITYGETSTTVELRAVVGEPWARDLQSDPSTIVDLRSDPPPPSVMATRLLLQDEKGREIEARSFSGAPAGMQRDPAAGTFTNQFTLTFDPLPADARALTLTLYLELYEPPADGPLVVDWHSGRQMSTAPLSIAGLPLSITSIERVAEDTLRLSAPVTTEDSAALSCINLYPPAGFIRDGGGCYRAGDAFTSELTLATASDSQLEPGGEMALQVTGTISFGAPWVVRWEKDSSTE